MKAAQLTLIPLMIIFLFACKTQTPPEPLIERNEEVREYMDVVGELVDEYCTLVEKVVDKAEALEEKKENGEEASFLDGLDMLGSVATSALKIKRLSDEMEEMEAKHVEFEKELSAADYEEFLEIYGTTVARFYDMAKRLEAAEDKQLN